MLLAERVAAPVALDAVLQPGPQQRAPVNPARAFGAAGLAQARRRCTVHLGQSLVTQFAPQRIELFRVRRIAAAQRPHPRVVSVDQVGPDRRQAARLVVLQVLRARRATPTRPVKPARRAAGPAARV